MTQTEWAEVPEHEKEEVLRAQRAEKWRTLIFEMYIHFNHERVMTLREMEGIIGYDMVRQDFETRLTAAMKHHRLFSLDFYSAVCGVHKSNISRYLRFSGKAIGKEPVSQREAESFTQVQTLSALFELARDHDADFSKLGGIIEYLPVNSDNKQHWKFALGMWSANQPQEVQDKIDDDFGIPQEQRDLLKRLISKIDSGEDAAKLWSQLEEGDH
jgi:hypothetical protein